MEADWSVELAADDPTIVVPWTASDEFGPLCLQFLDLRIDPAAIDQIAEARTEPVLRSALLTLNGAQSRLWTAKCDLWTSGSQHGGLVELDSNIVLEVDPREMDAEPEEAIFAAGCYIDIVPLDTEAGGSFAIMEHWLRCLTERLRGLAMRRARADFALRHSDVHGVQGFAVTWFIEACGATSQLAALRRAEALARTLPVVMEAAPAPPHSQTR